MFIKQKIAALFLSLLLIASSFTGCSSLDTVSSDSLDNNSSIISSVVSETSSVEVESKSPSSVGNGTTTKLPLSSIPEYSGNPFVAINNNVPNFSAAELTTTGYEKYSNLDSLGRCGVAVASLGKETKPAADEKRGDISSIYPTGWIQAKYNGISGGYLWNRCHLIGWQLSAENANKKNLITGTRYFNINGMLPFENMVADYLKEHSNNHVAYRVTPIFEGNNLVCKGVQIEAYSIEDNGSSIQFNVFCYNVQPNVTIDYATGRSSGPEEQKTTSSKTPTAPAVVSKPDPEASAPTPELAQPSRSNNVFVSKNGKKYHSNPNCSNMKGPSEISLNDAIGRGYEPCKKCYN